MITIGTLFFLIGGIIAIYIIYKFSHPKPHLQEEKIEFNIDFNEETNDFKGTLTFENGDTCSVSGTATPDKVSLTTSNDLIYNHYTGVQLEQLIQTLILFGKEHPTSPTTNIQTPIAKVEISSSNK